MRAITYDPTAPQQLALADVPEPRPGPGEVLLDVRAGTVNFGEVAFLVERRQPGFVPGNDVAGVVREAAADGSGPPVGTAVAGFAGAGGWAERCVLDTTQLAEVPAGVDLGAAAALPAAGVTALRALRGLGSVLGRRVLVTGASGGVGRYAVQLAARSGAHVVAAVGRPERGAGLTGLGAAEVVVGLAGLAPVTGVLDNVGGELLAQAYGLLEPGGLVQAIGMASLRPTTIDFEQLRIGAPGGRIEAFNVSSAPFGPDLAVLLELVRTGRLDPQVGWRGPWTDVADAVGALRDRRVAGKAVLEVG